MDDHFFIALPLPKDLKQHLKEQLKKTWHDHSFQKWVHEEDYHITLAFLGAISTDQQDKVIRTLQEQSRHWPPITLEFDKMGTFGAPNVPRIYWVGTYENHDLKYLQNEVKNSVASCGIGVDSRPYTPHITVARKWNHETDFKPKHVTLTDKPFTISHVDLFQTYPTSEPKYKPIHTFHLGRVHT